MKRKTGIFLIIGVIMLILLTGCGTGTEETASEDSKEADKLQIGLSFDSFVIERWLRDRDMFVSTAQGLGAEVNVQVAGGDVDDQRFSHQRSNHLIVDRDIQVCIYIRCDPVITDKDRKSVV